jgi:hypothetical protein
MKRKRMMTLQLRDFQRRKRARLHWKILHNGAMSRLRFDGFGIP